MVLLTSFFSGSVTGSTDSTTAGTTIASPIRQATVTTAGTSTIHSYTSTFEKSRNVATKGKQTRPDRQIAGYNPIMWIFDVALHLHTDYDHDGHYSNFSLSLDLDTSLNASTVYAVLYLANEGGPWNEYAVTGNFTVSGTGSADTFSLQAELDSGYPSGYYNHHIEIYDAYSHELIGSYGPDDSHQLYGLPIESRMHEEDFTFGTDISLSFTGTGALGSGPSLLIVAILMIRRRLKRSAF